MQLRAPLAIALLCASAPGCRGCDTATVEANPLEDCRKTLKAIAELPPERLAEWPTMYGQGCAGIYREPRCRQAWPIEGNQEPEVHTRTVILACSQDYCPLLEQPVPELCGMNRDAVDPVILSSKWPELHAAILAHDFGVGRDAGAVQAINRLFTPITVPIERPANAAATTPPLVIRVQQTGGKVEVTVGQDAGAKRWLLSPSPAEAELKQLREEFVQQAPTQESRAVIEANGEVPYGTVMKVLEAAKEAGYTKIALSVAHL